MSESDAVDAHGLGSEPAFAPMVVQSLLPSPNPNGRLPALDGLRGVAVLAVIVTHVLYSERLLQGGTAGVDVFFVLSGFLITFLLVREFDTCGGRINLARFYMRRALRLAPALLLVLTTVTLAGWLLFDPDRARRNAAESIVVLFYAANWARAFDVLPPRLLGHAWSLSIEEQFYTLWPLLLLTLLRLTTNRRALVTGLLLSAAISWAWRASMALRGTDIQRIYNGLDTRADSLLVGCALGAALASGLLPQGSRPADWLRRAVPASWLVLAVVFVIGDWTSQFTYLWVFTLVELAAAVLVLEVVTSERSRTNLVLSSPFLAWTGSISYGLYLWHGPVIFLLREWGAGLELMTLGVLGSFAIAASSYYWIERPLLRWKARLAMTSGLSAHVIGGGP